MTRILDPCCGSRMMYFDKKNPDVTFGDIRSETISVTDRSHGNKNGKRIVKIEPDIKIDSRNLPYSNGEFNMVVFDPPHIVHAGSKSWLAAKYGKLGADWRDDLHQGFCECFRVLADNGTLIFKWNETQVPVSEILKIVPIQPVFGHISGKRANTHWLVFMKP